MKRILLVDDEKNMLSVLELLFQQAGYDTLQAPSAEVALDLVEPLAGAAAAQVDLVISDLKLPGMDGIRFLRELRRRQVSAPFVLITAFGTVDTAVQIMKLGAVDVLTKPFAKETILETVAHALAGPPPAPATAGLAEGGAGSRMGDLVWASQSMQELAALMRKVGPVKLPVLLIGESGTGKDVAARALHQLYAGGKPGCPFVAVNCPAVPETLLESELFGYRKGAFTGADRDFHGKVQQANGGTLFLDEIGDLPLAIQPKLLRLLENRSYEALGSGQSNQVDIRIICATNRDLRGLVREGRFREDLYYRINTFTLELPPLRDRVEDIAVLARHFLLEGAARLSRPASLFAPEALSALLAHRWPGNVRELRNVVDRALVLASDPVIALADMPGDLRSLVPAAVEAADHPESLSTLDASERRLILDALERHQGNVSASARHLGISRNTLRYRMSKHGLAENHQLSLD